MGVCGDENTRLMKASRQQPNQQNLLYMGGLAGRAFAIETVRTDDKQLVEDAYLVGEVTSHHVEETLISGNAVEVCLRQINALKLRHGTFPLTCFSGLLYLIALGRRKQVLSGVRRGPSPEPRIFRLLTL